MQNFRGDIKFGRRWIIYSIYPSAVYASTSARVEADELKDLEQRFEKWFRNHSKNNSQPIYFN